MSDHNLILMNINIPNQAIETTLARKEKIGIRLDQLNFYNTQINWGHIRKQLNKINWGRLLQGKTVDDIFLTVSSKCLYICQQNITTKTKKRKSIIPRDQMNLIKKRKKLKLRLEKTTFQPART